MSDLSCDALITDAREQLAVKDDVWSFVCWYDAYLEAVCPGITFEYMFDPEREMVLVRSMDPLNYIRVQYKIVEDGS